jgi:cytochrome P450
MWLLDKVHEASEGLFEAMNRDEFELLGDAPGPTPSAPLGNAGDFIGTRSWEVLAGYEREYGPFVRFWVLNDVVVSPTSPELTEQVFLTDRASFYKDAPVDALIPLLTDVESFLANEPEWAAVSARSILRQDGLGAWLAAQVPGMRRATRARLASRGGLALEEAKTEIRRVGFDCFSSMAVGRTLGDDVWAALYRMLEEGDQRMNGLLITGDKSLDPAFHRARKAFWGVFRDAVAAARTGSLDGRDDMLAFALRGSSDLSDEELAVSLANLYFSGMLSSSSALQSLLWALSNHPDDRAAVQAEVDGLPADFTLEQVEALPHLDRCLREAMRLYPPVPIYLRKSLPDRRVTLGGWTLKEGTAIYLSNFATHRSARYWERPDLWKPARWTAELIQQRPYGCGEFWPFGRGPRSCSGEVVATAYIKTAAAEALRSFDVRLGAGEGWDGEAFFGTMVAKGMTASIAPR